jgi:hypothetical protein
VRWGVVGCVCVCVGGAMVLSRVLDSGALLYPFINFPALIAPRVITSPPLGQQSKVSYMISRISYTCKIWCRGHAQWVASTFQLSLSI